jgi:hypothetical protein
MNWSQYKYVVLGKITQLKLSQMIFPSRFVADTKCNKHPVQYCAANGCKFEPGEKECHNKTVQSAVDVPEESCDLVPQKTCQVRS